jgi:hypothetical protein
MPEHDFSALYDKYPAIIAQMPEIFTSHQFILELAHQNQVAYIEALYSYRHHLRNGRPTPFMIVHARLARHLAVYPHLIEQISKNVPSRHIFGYGEMCTEWRKRAHGV